MTNKEAIARLKNHFRMHDDGRPTPKLDEAVDMAIKALEDAGWIPFLEEGCLAENTPWENEKILVSSSDKVWQDTWICDDDEYFGGVVGLKSGKMLDGLAWKPMPKPWGGNKE